MPRSVIPLLLLPVLLLAGCQSLSMSTSPGPVATVWRVTGLQGEPFLPPQDSPENLRHYVLVLGKDGHISAYMGCNELHGDYQHEDDVLRIGPQLATHRDCGEAALVLERTLIRAMEGGSSYVLEGDTLSLRNPIGTTLISFQRDAAPAEKTAMP